MRKKHSLQVCIKIYWRFVCYEEDEGEAKGTKERKKKRRKTYRAQEPRFPAQSSGDIEEEPSCGWIVENAERERGCVSVPCDHLVPPSRFLVSLVRTNQSPHRPYFRLSPP